MNYQMTMSYKMTKLMKKLYGKNLGREIAIGRNMIKMISNNWSIPKIIESTIDREQL